MTNWNWKKEPTRFDPARGYMLCEPCWNQQHFNPAYKGKNGTRHPRTANCRGGACGCGCRPEFLAGNIKFTGEGQTSISMENPIEIGPKS